MCIRDSIQPEAGVAAVLRPYGLEKLYYAGHRSGLLPDVYKRQILIVFALLYWVGMARIVRSQVLTLKESEMCIRDSCAARRVPAADSSTCAETGIAPPFSAITAKFIPAPAPNTKLQTPRRRLAATKINSRP